MAKFRVAIGGAVLAAVAMLWLMPLGCNQGSETMAAMLGAATALRDKDWAAFQENVDVAALAEQVVDLTAEEITKRTKKQYRGLLGNVADLTKPWLRQQTEAQIERLVKSGEIGQRVPGLKSLPSSAVLQNLVRYFGAPEDDTHFEVVSVEKTDDTERLKIKVRRSASEPWLVLNLRSKKSGERYRIDRILNLADIKDRLLTEWQG